MTTTAEVWQGKRSGVPWLGTIPRHWGTAPLKYHLTLVNGLAFKPSEWSADGVPIIRIENLNGCPDFNCATTSAPRACHVLQGDLLFAWSGNRGTSFGPFIWSRPGLHYLNQHIFRVVNRNTQFDPKWLYWTLKAVTAFVESQAHGIIGLVHITHQDLGVIPIPIVPIEEQGPIAEFLVRETAKIDSLIEKKERLITLLEEKRAALINRAVTKGLDPSAPMKDSGIPWLGAVPAHWVIRKLKFAARLETGHTPSRQVSEYWENCTIPWVSLGDVWRFRNAVADFIDETEEKISELGLANSAARLLPEGTVIFSRTASVGHSAILARPMATTQDFVNWICGPSLLPQYLLHCFRTMTPYLLRLTMGSTHQTIYMPDVARFVVPVPPISEQQGIVSHVDGHRRRIDSVVAKTREQIAKFHEYRAALISAAVTGKIDVRGSERM